MKHFIVLFTLAYVPVAAAQSGPAVPQKHIPSNVLMELRALENQFDLALGQDCAVDRCFSKGCVYRDHVVVDMPRSGSLPGLGQSEGPGSVTPQEYLTHARCEFAHEKSVPAADVQALTRRLQQRLSKGWLQVTVSRQVLAPVSEELRQAAPPTPKAPTPPEEAVEPPAIDAAQAPPPEFSGAVAARELWLSLLPHFSWMIALVLVTLAALMIIWALRRLGQQTLEEKAMLAQLASGGLTTADDEDGSAQAPSPGGAPAPEVKGAEDNAFVDQQHRLWTDRVTQADLAKDDGLLVELLRDWLQAGEFDLLAKAIFVFGDRLSLAFPSDGELAMRKVELAEHLRTLDEKQLPSDAEFFRKLNHHAISSALLSQADADLYRSLREEFGSAGIAALTEGLPPRQGALLFALVPSDTQHEVARMLSAERRAILTDQLLISNRISAEERTHIFEVLRAARAGKPVPSSPPPAGMVDRGREFDAAGALSVLLPRVDPEQRKALFTRALQRSAGAFPAWYENILYPEMLLKVPEELQRDLFLEVDVKGLAGWSSVQHPAWQERFLKNLAPSMQDAVRASMGFSSRADQLRQARRGQQELVAAMKRLVARGKVSFTEIVG